MLFSLWVDAFKFLQHALSRFIPFQPGRPVIRRKGPPVDFPPFLQGSAALPFPLTEAQARSAAEGYTAKTLPGRRQPFLSPAALLILGASAAIIALWLCGLI